MLFLYYQRDQDWNEIVDRFNPNTPPAKTNQMNQDGLTADINLHGYDVNFNTINTAIVSGSFNVLDKSTLGFDGDYRKSPSLFASNALQGQQLDHLGDLLGRYDDTQIAQYAVDRSTDTYTVDLNYSRPHNEHLQFYGDLNESYTSGTDASAGVDAMPAEGYDTYADAELIGTGLWRENDLYVGDLRYARTSSSNQYQIGLGTKFPLTQALRISPATQFGYKTFNSDGRTEFHFQPSVGLNYALTRNASLEVDAGGHLTQRYLGTGAEHEWELLLTAGYRYDFYSAR